MTYTDQYKQEAERVRDIYVDIFKDVNIQFTDRQKKQITK
jgi:hypothetical protein